MTAASQEVVDRQARWGPVLSSLHWIVAGMVFFEIITGRLAEASDDRAVGSDLIRTHYQVGMLLAALMALRILWRLTHPAPPSAAGHPHCQQLAAKVTHASFYVLLVVLCVSGFIVWDYFDADMSVFGLVTAPDVFTPAEDERLRAGSWYVHAYAAWTVIGLIIFHVCAALWHQLVLRDGLFQRIL